MFELQDSTIRNLANNESYETPHFKYVMHYTDLTLTIFSDRNLAITIEFSSDGENIDATHSEDYLANTQQPYDFSLVSPWVKLKITNASGDNTNTLRCYLWSKR